MHQEHDYLTAQEAAAVLDVKLATLYAYTSRGLIKSIPSEKGRARLYLRRDLDRLRTRRDARAGHGPLAAAALRFGEPVLDSSITEISRELGPLYRGLSAVDLARRDNSFEATSELLWAGGDPDSPESRFEVLREIWSSPDLGMPSNALQALLPEGLPPLTGLMVVVPLLASRDPGRFAERRSAILPRARMLIRRMAAALALGQAPEAVGSMIERSLAADSLAGAVAAALGVGDASRYGQKTVALNRALVLGADHELNASTFAARVAASTGADIYSCVAAGLGGLSGPRHGGAADRVAALVDEIGEADRAECVVHERQRRGEAVEGFGHPLYPEGDPRGRMLLKMVRELDPCSGPARTCLALAEAMEGVEGAATLDLGLVALEFALGLPRGAAVGIYAVARCAGWVAHALEQYEAGYLLRPRARYLGHQA